MNEDYSRNRDKELNEYSKNRDRERSERIAQQQLETFARNVNRPNAAVPLKEKSPPNAVIRHFQEAKAPDRRPPPPPAPPAPNTLPVIIVVNGEFKTALLHYSGGLTDPPA